MSISLPDEAYKAAKDVILDFYSKRTTIGFLLKSMALNEMALCLSHAINKYVETQDIDVSIFTILNEPITLIPFASIYEIFDINVFEGTLIATDINTWIYLNNIRADKKYFYIYDPVLFNGIQPKLLENIKNSNTIFFTRSKLFAKYIKERYNIKCVDIEVPNFEIPLIRKIINE